MQPAFGVDRLRGLLRHPVVALASRCSRAPVARRTRRAARRRPSTSTTFTSVNGSGMPTVADRSSKLSSGNVCAMIGLASVMPKTIVGSAPHCAFTCSISGTGIDVPPVITLRSDDTSNSPAWKRGSCSIAMIIVGTAFITVALSCSMSSSIFSASNADRLDDRAAGHQHRQLVDDVARRVEQRHRGQHNDRRRSAAHAARPAARC